MGGAYVTKDSKTISDLTEFIAEQIEEAHELGLYLQEAIIRQIPDHELLFKLQMYFTS